MSSVSNTAQPREKLWNSNYLKVWCANFMIFFSFMLLTPLLPLYLSETFGADKEMIGIVLSGYTLTALIIRPFSGFLVDSLPRRLVLLVSYGLFCAFSWGIWQQAHSFCLPLCVPCTAPHSEPQRYPTALWPLMCCTPPAGPRELGIMV